MNIKITSYSHNKNNSENAVIDFKWRRGIIGKLILLLNIYTEIVTQFIYINVI